MMLTTDAAGESPWQDPEFLARRAQLMADTPRVTRTIESYGIELDVPGEAVVPRGSSHGSRMSLQAFVRSGPKELSE